MAAASRGRWLVSWSFPFRLSPPSVGDLTGPRKLLTDEKESRMLRKLPTLALTLLHPISLRPRSGALVLSPLHFPFVLCPLSKRKQRVFTEHN